MVFDTFKDNDYANIALLVAVLVPQAVPLQHVLGLNH